MNSVTIPQPPLGSPLQAAYLLSRKVEAMPGRPVLKDILHRLTFQKSGDSPGLHSVGYFGRQNRAQLYGYLVTDQEHKRYAERTMPVRVHPLPDEVRAPLRKAHEEIQTLNRACVNPILQRKPEWEKLLDPYGFHIPLNKVEDITDQPALILAPDAISDMAASFSSHFSFPVLSDIGQVPDTDYLEHEVTRLESELDYWGAMTSPPYIEAFKRRLAPGMPVRNAFRIAEAIVCLRASLMVLDQMLFQKLKDDKLPSLSDQEIFAVPLVSHHDTGSGMTVIFQPVGWSHLYDGGELIWIKAIENHTIPDQNLYLISGISKAAMLSAFSEDGAMGHCQLRPVDQNLCPFKIMWDGTFDRTEPHPF
jgi:hypothetical protein